VLANPLLASVSPLCSFFLGISSHPYGIIILYSYFGSRHRLNMELDLQSLFGLHVHSCSHWLT
jgi:hypothetical protein